MSRASRKANRESSRMANNAKVKNTANKSYQQTTVRKADEVSRLMKKYGYTSPEITGGV